MKFTSQKGAITVYLSIIFLAVAVVAGVLIDGARIRVGEAQVMRASEMAVKAALAGYSRSLKEDYGIFALNRNDPELLRGLVEEYLNKNLMTELDGSTKSWGSDLYSKIKQTLFGVEQYKDANFLNLFDYRVEDVKVTPLFNLSENEVTRNQILEFMKYRAPKELAEDFIEKLKGVKGLSKTSEACRKKMKLDEEAEKLAKLQQELKDQLESEEKNGVNRFGLDSCRYLDSQNSYISIYDACVSQMEVIRRLEEEYNSETDEKRRKSLAEVLHEAKGELIRLNASRNSACQAILQTLEDFKKSNTAALELIEQMKPLKKKLKEVIREHREYLKTDAASGKNEENSDLGSPPHMDEGFKAAYGKEIDKLERNIDEDDSESLQGKLNSNRVVLNNMEEDIRSFNSFISEESKGSEFIVQVTGKYRNAYQSIRYFDTPVRNRQGEQEKDPRREAARKAKDVLEEKQGVDKEIKNQQELPSFHLPGSQEYPNKVISPDFSLEKGKPQQEEGHSLSAYELEAGSIGFGNEGFAQNGFGLMETLQNGIGSNLQDLRDKVYINEYIMGMFKNAVPQIREGDSRGNYNLRMKDKGSRAAFFDKGEVEYILHGKKSESTNLMLVRGQILLVRFVADTISTYCDEKKVAAAEGIAIASSWWNFGLGEPVVKNLVICGMGMADAVKDLKEIMDGKSVELFKRPGAFSKGGSTSAGKLTMFSYHDYLRLFLLLQGEDEKLNRIEDLVQLNIQKSNADFKISDYHTYLRVEISVSIRYFFITQPFIPRSMKTSDGSRHQYKFVLYEGY